MLAVEQRELDMVAAQPVESRSVAVEQGLPAVVLEFVVFQLVLSIAFVDNVLSRLLPVLLHDAYGSRLLGQLRCLEVFGK